MNNPLYLAVLREFADSLKDGKIPAIKKVRELTGYGLREAKDFVEEVEAAVLQNTRAYSSHVPGKSEALPEEYFDVLVKRSYNDGYAYYCEGAKRQYAEEEAAYLCRQDDVEDVRLVRTFARAKTTRQMVAA
jgi:hypothetical protein